MPAWTIFLLALAAAAPLPDRIERHVAMTPGASVLVGAGVPAGTPLVFYSAKLPASGAGDTEQQALGIFDKLDRTLAKQGLGFGDIVKMTVYLVAPAGRARPDYDGFDRAYRARFGTAAQPQIVAQTIVQVAGFRDPAHLVAVDVVAAGRVSAASPAR